MAEAIARAAERGAERTVAVRGAGAGRGGASVRAARPRPHWVVPLYNKTLDHVISIAALHIQ